MLGAHQVLLDAFQSDVRPLLEQVRSEMGLATDPIAAYHGSGYREKITSDRRSVSEGSAGYGGA